MQIIYCSNPALPKHNFGEQQYFKQLSADIIMCPLCRTFSDMGVTF